MRTFSDFQGAEVDIFVPGGGAPTDALGSVTHLAIGAHHDDLEFMALAAIEHCRRTPGDVFGGVVCTDGRGSARAGAMSGKTSEELAVARIAEQREAALLGGYGIVIQLGMPSAAVKGAAGVARLAEDLAAILRVARPREVLMHNFADKHPTHIAVAHGSLAAVRLLPRAGRPQRLLGCEGWRGLDWLPDTRKVLLNAGEDIAFAQDLFGVFRSQIRGGKRYDRAILGRKFANATMRDPHSADGLVMAETAMDLTPLVEDETRDAVAYTLEHIDAFREEVVEANAHYGS